MEMLYIIYNLFIDRPFYMQFDGDAGKMLCQSCSLSATNQVTVFLVHQ